ncbi:MAG TPA: hypothetical protein VFX96_18960 [Pyrinomonadaceae bacterium]|nr:hypothetical protein [Pyrinomonadaceae bacterium]
MALLRWLDTARIIVTAVLTGGRVSLSGDQSIRRDKGKKKKKKGGRRPAGSEPAGAAQTKELIEVGGWNLESRLDEAVRQGRATGGRFWVAYSFALRPGVRIENAEGVENPLVSHGPPTRAESDVGEATPAPARALLMLAYAPEAGAGATPARVEISELAERSPAEVAAAFAETFESVYWLGEAEAEESLTLLDYLIRAVRDTSDDGAAARLTDAVAFHDANESVRVAALLERLATEASSFGARRRAVAWLGRTPAGSSFVLEVARDKSQPLEVRSAAVRALIKEGGRAARAASASGGEAMKDAAERISLHQLYETVGSDELKAEIIIASPKRGNMQEVVQFLQEVGRSEPDAALRQSALWRLNSKKVLGT